MAAPFQDHAPAAMAPYKYQPLGYQQITSFSSATGLTRPGDNAVIAVIQVEGVAGTDSVRWRDDGVAPTTSVGMLIDGTNAASTSPQPAPMVYSGDLTAIQFIVAAGSPKLNISYYR
jgi:hypothetical protein